MCPIPQYEIENKAVYFVVFFSYLLHNSILNTDLSLRRRNILVSKYMNM